MQATLRRSLAAAVLAIGALTGGAATQTDEPPEPSSQESAIFAQKLERLQEDAELVPEGHEVDDAVASLVDWVELTIPCEDAEISEVRVRIRTTVKGWSKRYVTTHGGSDTATGHYTWRTGRVVDAGVKTLDFDNFIMLDPAVTVPHEAQEWGALVDETLLYHELLHAQLLIDVMRNDEAWRSSVCACNDPDLTGSDPGHATIHGLEIDLMEALGEDHFGADVTITLLEPTPEGEADEEGRFRIPIPVPEGKESFGGAWLYFPTDANVEDVAFETDDQDVIVVDQDGNMHITGTLIDPTRPGYIQVHLDPPLSFLASGVEPSIRISPAQARFTIPVASAAGMILMLTVLAAAALAILARRT